MSMFKAALPRTLPWILIVCGVIGLIAAFVIMVEKVHLLEDPGFQPGCNLNPVISCGSVMSSAQSHAFGFPNPILGLIGFPIVIMTGVLLLAGTALKRWYMLGLQAGTLFGLLFVHWLFFQSVYRIGALCPYCMAVWIVTITTFWYVVLYNIQKGYLLSGRLQAVGTFLQRHHLDILLLCFLILFVLALQHFWYYYGPVLGFS